MIFPPPAGLTIDRVEAEELYDLLENEVVPTFYERGTDDLPRDWIERMKRSMQLSCLRICGFRQATTWRS